MKKITILLLTLALVSCQDKFLELTPDTNGSVGNFYQTKDQFIQAINSAYSQLQGIHNNTIWILAELRSDNTSYQLNTGDRSGTPREEIDEFRDIDQNPNFQTFFNSSYLGISRCNLLLTKIQTATFDQASRNQIEGEARFLRAYYYFNLARVFGDVPLILKEVTTPEEAFTTAARVPEAQVFAAVIDDFKAAITKLPAKYPASDAGRATSGAAKTLLGEVYMSQKNYTAAADILKTIEAEGGYSLNTNYADNFKRKNTAESIFEVQYAEGAGGKWSTFAYSFAPFNSGTLATGFALGAGSAAGWNIPTQDLINAYEPNDRRLAVSINQNFIDPTSKKVVPFVQKYANPPYLERFNTGDNFIVTRLADVLLMQAEAANEGSFPSAEAFTLLNRVRTRAGLASKSTTATDAKLRVSSQAEFRAAIAQERRVELAFENHRWFDLVRTGQAVAVMTAHAVAEKAAKSYILPSAFVTINPKFPYPFRETQITQ
jgi:starch-binding outer membrane protein, SusD/RagB family